MYVCCVCVGGYFITLPISKHSSLSNSPTPSNYFQIMLMCCFFPLLSKHFTCRYCNLFICDAKKGRLLLTGNLAMLARESFLWLAYYKLRKAKGKSLNSPIPLPSRLTLTSSILLSVLEWEGCDNRQALGDLLYLWAVQIILYQGLRHLPKQA